MTESKLRFWEIALLFALAAALMWGSWSLQQQDRLERKMIRLHVIANSDSEADQALKLQVRDRVLTLATDILRRADSVFAYQLAVVADDIDGGVTQIVRGRDLLSSTPRQLFLYRLLGAAPPKYYHVPLLTAPDGRRLSKRDRDLDLGILRERFTAPELLGRLAHAAKLLVRPEPVSAEELIPLFDWAKIPKDDIAMDI